MSEGIWNIAETRMNIINRLHQYAKTGNRHYLSKSGDPDAEEKYNFIIMKFDQLKENKYAQAIEKIVNYSNWREEFQPEIKSIFTTKRADSIIHRIKNNLKSTAVIQQIISLLRTYNSKCKVYRYLSEESAPEQISAIIIKISACQQSLRLAAEFPSNVNMEKLKETINKKLAELGASQISDLTQIYLLKDCIRFVEQKLKTFQKNQNRNRGTFDQHLTDRIREPLQKLLRDHQHALNSLNQFKCTPNTTSNGFKNEETTIRNQISSMNRRLQQVLRRCDSFSEQNSRQIDTKGQLTRLSANINTISQIFSGLIETIQKASAKDNKNERLNNQIYPSYKPLLARGMETILEWIRTEQHVKVNETKPYNARSLQQINNDIKDLQERTVLLNRWQTIWKQMNFGNRSQIYLDRNQYPKKGENDEPLSAICEQITTLQKCHNDYLQILGCNKNRKMTEDEQFLKYNPNIKEQFYRDKETIKKMSQNEIIIKGEIDRQQSQLQELRSSQKQKGQLLNGIQLKINKILNIKNSIIRNIKDPMGGLNQIEQIFNQKTNMIKQASDQISRINSQLAKLNRQITTDKNIFQLQIKNLKASNKRNQEKHVQLMNKANNRSLQLQYSNQIMSAQLMSLNQEYVKNKSQLEQLKRYRAIQRENIESYLSQAQENVDFATVINIEPKIISFNQFVQRSQLIIKFYMNQVIKLEQTIKENVDRYISSQFSLRKLKKYVQKMKNNNQVIRGLKKQLIDLKNKFQLLQNDLKNRKTDQEVTNYKQTITKNNAEIIKLKGIVQDLNGEMKKQKSLIANLKMDLQTAQSDKKNLQMEIDGLNIQLSMVEQNSRPAPYNIKYEEIEQNIKKLNVEIANLKDQLRQKTKYLSQANSKLSQSQDVIRRYENDHETFKSELKKKNEMIERFKVTSSANTNQNLRTNHKKIDQKQLKEAAYKQISIKYQSQFLARKQRLMKIYATKYSNSAQQINQALLKELYLACVDHFFQGELMQQQIVLKYRLASHLETFTGMPILRTKLVFTFDLKNKTNFHLYIDGVSSLLFIVKTVTGLYLAGYYTGKYLEGPMLDSGLLISISNNESYKLNVPDYSSKNSYRCMVYDPYFIIFGNAQMRIKTGQKILFSNFGIMNSYFNTNNKKLKDFIGSEDNREVEIESYEIYQVLFNNEYYDD